MLLQIYSSSFASYSNGSQRLSPLFNGVQTRLISVRHQCQLQILINVRGSILWRSFTKSNYSFKLILSVKTKYRLNRSCRSQTYSYNLSTTQCDLFIKLNLFLYAQHTKCIGKRTSFLLPASLKPAWILFSTD